MKMLMPKANDDVVEGEIIRIDPTQIEVLKPLPVITAIANRFRTIYADKIAAMRVQENEVIAVVERAIAAGHDPFSTDFHWWKDGNTLAMMDHYSMLTAWAQEKDPFKVQIEVEDTGDPPDLIWVGRAVIVKDRDFPVYRQLFESIFQPSLQAGKDVAVAMKVADDFATSKVGYVGEGTVKFIEVYTQQGGQWVVAYKNTPKGWTPGVTRAEKRALRNAIRLAYGAPSPFERAMRGRQVLERLQNAIAAPDHILTAGSEVTDRFHKLNEMALQLAPSSPEELEERVSQIRGTASPITTDFIDEPKAPKTIPEQIFKIFQEKSVPDKSIVPLAERLTGKVFKELGEPEFVMATMYAEYIPHLRGKMPFEKRAELIPVLKELVPEDKEYQLPELKEILEAHVRNSVTNQQRVSEAGKPVPASDEY